MSADGGGRSRRALSQNALKKMEALEKLRSLNRQGSKNKYEYVEEDDVYEEVDEEQYAELVNRRQREDWIVDDDGAGYAEHGREIFDEDDDFDDNDNQNSEFLNQKQKNRNKYKLMSAKSSENETNKNDIRSIFNSMSVKKTSVAKQSLDDLKPAPLIQRQKKKSLNEVKIDDNEIENLVDSIISTTPKSSPSIGSNLSSSSFQPIRLQKKQSITPTNSSLKRKSFQGKQFSSASKANVNELPPFKRRNVQQIKRVNFDDIINEEEISKNSTQSLSKQSIKLEPNDDDDDHFLPDNTNFDDNTLINSATKPSTDKIQDKIKFDFNIKVDRFPDEEWIVSGNSEQNNDPPKQVQNVIPKDIPFETDEDQNKLLKFYWFDAFHDIQNQHNADRVFLFGKVFIENLKKFISCCVQVKNLERRIFILPREHFQNDCARRVQIEDVYKEFAEDIAPQMKIKRFRSRKVVKKYSFELDGIPQEAEYLEVLYSAQHPPLQQQFIQGNSYRHIFGINASILENLILDLNLMGPGWLVLKNPEITEPPISWCKLEFTVQKPLKQISVLKLDSNEKIPRSPDFTILSLCFKTFVHSETKSTDLIAISCLESRNFNFDSGINSQQKFDNHFCIITKIGGKGVNSSHELPVDFNAKMALKDYRKTKVHVMNNERELLMFFMAKFQQIDPDIIIGHDVYNFDYDILLQRFSYYRIPMQWSKLGRLKCSGLPIRAKDKHLLAGRLICDVKIMSRELIRSKSYDLTELSAQLLKKGRFEIGQHLLPGYYENSQKLLRLVEFLMKDNDLILSIAFELNCLPLVKQITNIAGNLLSRTLLGGRSERNEFLLLHAFHQRGYIVPDKAMTMSKNNPQKNQTLNVEVKEEDGDGENPKSKKNSTSYTGGLVLQPKIGYYDRFILLMDFNSLYPSIIQEYNICFTTITKNGTETQISESLKNTNDSEGVLPVEIRKLVDSRRQVKLLLCDPNIPMEQRGQLDIKQKALKITANSMYGCLGFDKSRFYAKHLAALVTQKGREILMNTKEMVEQKLGFDVIYGDTDSIMILTNCLKYEDVYEIGKQIKTEVNRLYRLLEIDIDGVFKCMLLLKKKKYAALAVSKGPNKKIQYQREIKGLDIVRRDWSLVAKLAGEAILDQILKQPDDEQQSVSIVESVVDNIHQYLKQLAQRMRAGELELESFVINKALAKRPEEYGEQGKNLTHVMIALRYNQQNLGKKLVSGDTVPYVICLDGTKNAATQRGYHIDEVRQRPDELQIDIEYYLSQQLLPVVSRLCDPIDGTDTDIIAEFLGIESYKRSHKSASHHNDDDPDPALTSGNHKFDCCHSLMIKCPFENCGKQMEIRDTFRLWNQKNKKRYDLKELKTYPADVIFDVTIGHCEHCQQSLFGDKIFSDFYLDLEIRKQIQKHIHQFYQKWMICDDHVCSHRTRYLSGLVNQKRIVCPRCRNGNLQPEVSEHFIYQQLTFFHHIFDLEQAMLRFNSFQLPEEFRTHRNAIKEKYGPVFRRLRSTVQEFLDQSSYNEFDLGYLFRKFRYAPKTRPTKTIN